MNCFRTVATIALVISTASCASNIGPRGYGMPGDFVSVDDYYSAHPADLVTVDDYSANARAPTMDPGRKVSEQDCAKSVEVDGSNLRCE